MSEEALGDLAEACAFALHCAQAAGLAERLEVSTEARERVVRVGGPDGFGFLGTTQWRVVRVPLPATRRALALAVARHQFGEYWATDEELVARAAELPLALALVLAPEGL